MSHLSQPQTLGPLLFAIQAVSATSLANFPLGFADTFYNKVGNEFPYPHTLTLFSFLRISTTQ